MSCECNFEAKIPVDCVRELIGMVRNGSVVLNKSRALQVAGTILGQIGGVLGTVQTPIFGDVDAPSNLEACCEAVADQMPEGEVTGFGSNPSVAMLVAKLIEYVLKEILS